MIGWHVYLTKKYVKYFVNSFSYFYAFSVVFEFFVNFGFLLILRFFVFSGKIEESSSNCRLLCFDWLTCLFDEKYVKYFVNKVFLIFFVIYAFSVVFWVFCLFRFFAFFFISAFFGDFRFFLVFLFFVVSCFSRILPF